MAYILQMSDIVTDTQVVDALYFKHHQFTTKFCDKNNPIKWKTKEDLKGQRIPGTNGYSYGDYFKF